MLLGNFIVIALIVCNASASDSLILKAGTVLVGDGTALKNVVVVIKEEKIDFIGREYPIRKGTQILDYSKSIITPGFIAANATLKVVKHTNEEQFESTPEMNLLYSINPQAKDFEKAWRSGVTCVYLAPGNLNVINGTGTILKTVGKTPQQMLLRNQVHMKVTLGKEPALGNSPPRRDPIFLRTRRPQNRMGIIFVFRSEFINLQNKRDVSESLLSAQEILLRNVLEGEIPLRIRARSYIDIKSAFRMMQEFGYHWILEDGVDAYRYLDDLKRHKIPVIYGPVYKLKGGSHLNRENDLYLAVTPILLDREGILFAFQNNDWSPISSLRDEAMYAVELGMTKDSALKALTMNAAKILGVEHRVGSLEKGKDADILIFNGDPLEPCSRLEQVIINGKLFDPNK
ncbi:MAG: amidohydrolase family protein [Candidatus Aminicenantes bacterium]|nr:MAG: amidohydrolase family protein [Candidatus Aminicenantes bacterium]